MKQVEIDKINGLAMVMICRETGNKEKEADSLLGCANTEMREGHLDKAQEYVDEAEAIADSLESAKLTGKVYMFRGIMCMNRGQFEEAEGFYDKTIAVLESDESAAVPVANAYKNKGDSLLRRGKQEEARECFLKTESICREKKNALGLANALTALGNIDMSTKQLDVARVHYTEAFQIFQALKFPFGIADALLYLGDLEIASGNLEQADKDFEAALNFHEKLGGVRGNLIALRGLCFVNGKLHNAERVTLFANKATDFLKQNSVPESLATSTQKAIEKALSEI